jgi:hypothetical protein
MDSIMPPSFCFAASGFLRHPPGPRKAHPGFPRHARPLDNMEISFDSRAISFILAIAGQD